MSTDNRKHNLARVHSATKAVGLEGEKYKAWLKKRTGKESCSDLTDEALRALVAWLKPTRAQWMKVNALAREIGLSGFEDEGFRTFVRRVVKEDNPRLLSRLQVHRLIAGLVRWADSRRQRGPVPPPGPGPQTDPRPTAEAPTGQDSP